MEVVDDAHTLTGEPDPLAQVTDIDPLDMTAVLKTADGSSLPDYTEGASRHPLLRRWDYVRRDPSQADLPRPAGDAALLIDGGKWLTLEDSIQIWFESPQQEPQRKPIALATTGSFRRARRRMMWNGRTKRMIRAN